MEGSWGVRGPVLCVGACFSALIKKKGINKIKQGEKEKGRERNVALEIIGLCLLQKQYHQLLKPELFSETRK